MSRIRTIKPEFWTSEQVIACSPIARLIFIGLWNFCDDNGVHPASHIRLKAEVFPGDDLSTIDINKLVNELINHDLIREYMIDDKNYWIVTGWKKHQRIDKPTYRHPLPQYELRKIEDNSTTHPRDIDECSSRVARDVGDDSATEWKGMEGIGMEKEIREVETSPACVSGSSALANTHELFNYWQLKMNHPRAIFDAKRQRKVAQALKLYDIEDLKKAIDGCSLTPHNMGKNDSCQIYDDISLILRDADHIERFMNNANANHVNDCKSTDDLMAGVI